MAKPEGSADNGMGEGRYRISSNKCWASNKGCPVISTAPLGIHIEISASL